MAETDRFLRWAAICEAAGLGQDGAEAVLQAAWLREDAGVDASDLRRRAAAGWQGDILRRIDILRRAGAHDEALTLSKSLGPLDEEAARIVAFEQARIAERDSGRHSIASALRPPARSPHVTHGQKHRAGWLSRILGR